MRCGRRDGGMKLFPVPISTPGFDAAPYLTATLCITKDPETGIQNIGTYRAALKATDRLVVRMVARAGGAGGFLHWQKYQDRKEPMPIAIVIGAAPVVMFTGAQKLATDVDEIGVAGALAGRAVPIARCATIDIDVPASSEIVIEGLIDTDKLEPEAPFGESNGYVALEAFNMPMRVTAITHRRHPVFASIISQVTPSESSLVKKVAYEPLYLAHLRDTLSVRGVRRVVLHEPLTNLRPVIFVQFAPGTVRSEVWRGLNGAAAFQAIFGKLVIAVSEDIDPANLDAVLWSIAYRCNPIDDVQIAPYHGGDQGSQYSSSGRGLEAPDRCDRQGSDAAAGAAEKGIHGTGAGPVGEARPAADRAQGALARLSAGRLDRPLGHLCGARRERSLGGDRQGNTRPPAQRPQARNPGAQGGGVVVCFNQREWIVGAGLVPARLSAYAA